MDRRKCEKGDFAIASYDLMKLALMSIVNVVECVPIVNEVIMSCKIHKGILQERSGID